ncbi:hypothetical protein K32_37920 [Kaistia sp. 32K]|uniref:hypothetical protein n=1 Tax=Kaistia sp. 32K TaxID=2795690 RepID=UPI0019154205|nr:hypothetical protein [Kaistia sp. 32K]BCP55175.1 hypothetical protein K32_37920 [Kaistia sp. 32K]
MDDKLHPVAIEHLPFFITAPGQTDVLFNVMVGFVLVVVLVVGNLYFQLHAVPERMAHRANRVQMEIVAILALISLATHNHLFWIAGLLLAVIQIPDFSTPMASIAASLEKLSGRRDGRAEELAAIEGPLPPDALPAIAADTGAPEPPDHPPGSKEPHGKRPATGSHAPKEGH